MNTPSSYAGTPRIHSSGDEGAEMARILICADDVAVERLLRAIVTHMGHDPEVLDRSPVGVIPAGDLFLVDPTAARSTAWADALRSRDSEIPVVAIGLNPTDLRSLGFAPTEVVGKPFDLDELMQAIDRALLAA